MTSIHWRPPEIETRSILGHWEGDLIKGARNTSAASKHASTVERTGLVVSLAKVDNASAQAAVAGFSSVLNGIDVQCRLSVTYD